MIRISLFGALTALGLSGCGYTCSCECSTIQGPITTTGSACTEQEAIDNAKDDCTGRPGISGTTTCQPGLVFGCPPNIPIP